MVKKTFYEKVGNSYKPVYEYDEKLMESFPYGSTLVTVYPNGRNFKYHIDPAFAPMVAAGKVAKDSMIDCMAKGMRYRPSSQPLTERQLKLWKELSESFDKDNFVVYGSSIHDAVEAGLQSMMEEANKLLTNPAVKAAYDHFLLVCELTKSENSESRN